MVERSMLATPSAAPANRLFFLVIVIATLLVGVVIGSTLHRPTPTRTAEVHRPLRPRVWTERPVPVPLPPRTR